MMQYSKGDTIELKHGRIALILNDGLKHEEFFRRFNNTTICEIYYSCALVHWRIGYDDPIVSGKPKYVWYYTLIGDEKAWYRIKESK